VHLVFDEACREAEKLGLRVTGSELVGLIPLEALLMAGQYYLEKQGKSSGVPEGELIRTAVMSLGLNDVSPFDPEKKIIERQFKDPTPSLLNMSLRDFANNLSMDSPTPGGGSVAALCGALSAALSSMVANLTVGKKGYEEVEAEMKETAVRAQVLKEDLLRAVDDDTRAFNKVMDAYRLPKTTEDQKKEKEAAVEHASKEATLVPFSVLEKSLALLDLARTAALKGNRNSLSDAAVAGLMSESAASGGYYNVRINLPNIQDKTFKEEILAKADSILDEINKLGKELSELVAEQLSKT
jgi:formiminotetrahydrofolate cyclodeaminase